MFVLMFDIFPEGREALDQLLAGTVRGTTFPALLDEFTLQKRERHAIARPSIADCSINESRPRINHHRIQLRLRFMAFGIDDS